LKDTNTRPVFGDCIDIYDIKKSVDDQATVSIYYEGRLAKPAFDPKQLREIDDQFDEVTEGKKMAAALAQAGEGTFRRIRAGGAQGGDGRDRTAPGVLPAARGDAPKAACR